MQRVFEGLTHSVPPASPFFLEALCDALAKPELPLLPDLTQLSVIFIGAREGLLSQKPELQRLARILENHDRFPSFSRISINIEEPEYILGLFGLGSQGGGSVRRPDADELVRELWGELNGNNAPAEVAIHAI